MVQLGLLTGLLMIPGLAAAQYKNNSFSLDATWMVPVNPFDALDNTGQIVRQIEAPGYDSTAWHLRGKTNLKLDSDRWWFSLGVDLALFQHAQSSGTGNQAAYDGFAKDSLGTIVGFGGEIGVRYFFLTDRIRPYLQTSLSYMRLFPTGELAAAECDIFNEVCESALTVAVISCPIPTSVGYTCDPGLNFSSCAISECTSMWILADGSSSPPTITF
ncbi:MAG: hypothetical protein R3C68_00125 [Myxococcota bacterium]